MVDLSDDPDTHNLILDYLTENYPPKDHRAATHVAGDKELHFEEWQAPTLGQRSRDPIEAPDGSIWWAAQWGNLIGHLSPETGELTEYELPEGAMPHTVLLDREGYVWYTGNKNATMGRLDPTTGEVVEYHLSHETAKDPHSAVFDDDGILWFTVQQGNMIGRLDPETGEISLLPVPTDRSLPYGIKIDENGNPWAACFGNNCLLRIDPDTLDVTEIELPHEDTRVRRLDIDDNGNIWFVNSSRGRLGRYDPKTDEVTEWDSPSGDKSHPYAIAVLENGVWYNESGVRPDMLVHFDPETETFQSWPILSGDFHAGIVRHMRPTDDGGLVLHQSASNRIFKVNVID